MEESIDTDGAAVAETHVQSSQEGLTWSERLLGPSKDAIPHWRGEALRMASAVGLASLFGGALGLRLGGAAIVTHALGVPLGLIAIAALGAPAFAIVLALANAPVGELSLARATARASVNAGLVLGGLAPAAALFVVTVEDAITVTIMGSCGLLLAGAIGLRAFAHELAPELAVAPDRTRRITNVALPAFLVFASILAARIWWMTLPAITAGVS